MSDSEYSVITSEVIKSLDCTFENLLENGAFASKEQMLHFSLMFSDKLYFKGINRRYYGVKG